MQSPSNVQPKSSRLLVTYSPICVCCGGRYVGMRGPGQDSAWIETSNEDTYEVWSIATGTLVCSIRSTDTLGLSLCSWHPDSSLLCFKGDDAASDHVAVWPCGQIRLALVVIDAHTGKIVWQRDCEPCMTDVTWHPAGTSLIVSVKTRVGFGHQELISFG